MQNPFRYFNSSPEVIRLTVMMYIRYPLSLRQAEDLLFERGIDICHETVRFWWNRFGPMFACRSSKSDMPQYPWLSGHRQDSLLAMRMMLCLLLLALLRAVDPDVAATHLEKLALRQQLAVFKSKRPQPWLRQRDRLFWVLLARIWPDWRDALVIVKPATVIGWHRRGFKVFWTWKSRPRRAGRPRVQTRSANSSAACAERIRSGGRRASTVNC